MQPFFIGSKLVVGNVPGNRCEYDSRSDAPSSRSFQVQSLNCRKKPDLDTLFICLYFYEH